MKTFEQLLSEVQSRAEEQPRGSVTVKLLRKGPHAIGKKLVEEAAEAWIAAEYESNERVAEELAQLIYHAQVMMVSRGLTLEDIERYL